MLVLNGPNYAIWLLTQTGQTDHFRECQQELCRLAMRFDEKPYVVPCQAEGCQMPATRERL
jgi:hypothetical protein